MENGVEVPNMKLTWTKTNPTKKRIRNPVSHFSVDDQNQTLADQPSGELAADESELSHFKKLSDEFQAQGNKLAEEGKFSEALVKWEAALNLTPEKAILHEQKAQVLLEIGDAWKALKAATRATELEPSWAEAWITLGRTQLNFGEPDNAVDSFNRALAIKPDSLEAQEDKKTASHLIRKRKMLHSSGLTTREDRFVVGNKVEEEQDSQKQEQIKEDETVCSNS